MTSSGSRLESSPPKESVASRSLGEFLAYFLKLGTLGSGGPIALPDTRRRIWSKTGSGFRLRTAWKAWLFLSVWLIAT